MENEKTFMLAERENLLVERLNYIFESNRAVRRTQQRKKCCWKKKKAASGHFLNCVWRRMLCWMQNFPVIARMISSSNSTFPTGR